MVRRLRATRLGEQLARARRKMRAQSTRSRSAGQAGGAVPARSAGAAKSGAAKSGTSKSGGANSTAATTSPATPTRPASRLVPAPVFVLSTVRSGSTLLRVVLNSHPQICAPHELHLRCMRVNIEKSYAEKSADLLGLDPEELEHLLWDRIMHRELTTTGKSILIDKTPANASFWPRLLRCWPDARFIYLLRHPASIVASYMRGHDDRTIEASTSHIGKYIANIESARAEVPGLTVRYEDLTSDPEGQTRQLCSFLGVDWDPSMVNYGEHDHGPFRGGVGDWSKNIRSGRIQPAREVAIPEDAPDELRQLCRTWGYPDN